MLDFTLTPDQQALRAKGRAFAEEVLRPVCRHYDQTGEWAQPVFQRAWEQGILQACVPGEWGGAGLSHLEEAILFEEIGWGCAGFFTSLSCNGLATVDPEKGARGITTFIVTQNSIRNSRPFNAGQP